MSWEIWITALVLYGIFCLWYFNTKGPLSTDEIDKYIKDAEAQTLGADLNDLRKFLEEDDGKEFVMQNMLTLKTGEVPHPVTGEMTHPRKLIQLYFQPFMKSIFKRAGHPVHQALRLGGRIDAWDCPEDPGYRVWAMVRYRSRRDMMVSLAKPEFAHLHVFKQSALSMTEAYPQHANEPLHAPTQSRCPDLAATCLTSTEHYSNCLRTKHDNYRTLGRHDQPP